jgi:hypothetical protein
MYDAREIRGDTYGHGRYQAMRIIIAGSRYIGDQSVVDDAMSLAHYHVNPVTSVLTGMCIGIDFSAAVWAHSRRINVEPFPAVWPSHGRAAGPIRNQAMVDTKPDALIAILLRGRKCTGTRDVIKRATRANILVYEFTYESTEDGSYVLDQYSGGPL